MKPMNIHTQNPGQCDLTRHRSFYSAFQASHLFFFFGCGGLRGGVTTGNSTLAVTELLALANPAYAGLGLAKVLSSGRNAF